MTHKKRTISKSNGQGLFQDSETLKKMVELLVSESLDAKLQEYIGVGYYERGEDRCGHRNGYKPRTMNTRIGKLEFALPQLREGTWHPDIFERYQRSEAALLCTLQEMVIQGVSTRKVGEVLQEMCGYELSASTVSKAAEKLDEAILQFRERSLSEESFPYLIVDARYENIRQNGHVTKQAVLIAAGVSSTGVRQILGFMVGDSENEATWGEMFSSLKDRGLKGVNFLISDAHKGIISAMGRYFQGAQWQRCRVHFARNLLNRVSYQDRFDLAKDLRSIYKSDDMRICLLEAERIAKKWSKKYQRLSETLLEGIESCLTTKQLPWSHEHRISTTNMLERLMRECKRRSKVISIFPNESSCLRYLGSVLMETNDKWIIESQKHRFLNMETDNEGIFITGRY
jgi:putative transposase